MVTKAKHLHGIAPSLMRELFENAPPGAINLSLGDGQTPISPRVVEAGCASFQRGDVRYTPNAGYPHLLESIAQTYQGKLCFPVAAPNVLATAGSIQAIYESLLAHINPGDQVLYPVPGFPPYPKLIRFVHGEPIPYHVHPQDGYRLPLEEIEVLMNERTRAIIVNSPHNPTGSIYPIADLQPLAGLINARQGHLFAICDEVYADIVYHPHTHASLAAYTEHAIVISGISKTYGLSGMRLGWAVSTPETIKNLLLVHQNMQGCAPSVSQNTALAALAEPTNLAYYANLRAATLEALDQTPIPYHPPAGAIYAYLDVSRWGDVEQVARALSKAGVILTPASEFGDANAMLRLCFAYDEGKIREAVRRMSEVLV
jgi:aspartate aminotransferase